MMKKNSTPPFLLEEKKDLRPEYLASAKIYKHILKYSAFQHVRISDQNRVAAFKAIWLAFMKFAEECHAEMSGSHKQRPFQYLSACDMPIALMPDGSQIICSNTLPQNPTSNFLFFLWIRKEGSCHV